ncbi:DoxX-like family protein [Halocatena marina]|uniref:DoxX-like family protein n=1 Tax=Halocatena marina TaxID=2934937 RepID=UPI0036F436D2
MPSNDAIYVEIPMDASIQEVWEPTQNPNLHQRWDLRFSEIEYLPRDSGESQQFTYSTGIGAFAVEGVGESVADATPTDHEPTSALQFWSDDPKSLIEHGRGYWRYVPGEEELRFITEYNYDTRFGVLGRLVDRLAFRPLIGWATAWGFDALRLWVEDDLPPEVTTRNAAIHALSRVTLAFVWIFLGLVPKLLVRHPTERALTAATVPASLVDPALTALGSVEIGFGLFLLLSWRWRWPLVLSAILPPVLTFGALAARPGVFVGPFSPLISTLALVILALTGYLAGAAMPTARNCLRTRPQRESRDNRETTEENGPAAIEESNIGETTGAEPTE